MAKDKRSFILYSDIHFTVQKLADEKAGQLFKHILAYVNDENPTTSDMIIEIAFEPIKQALKRDLRRYETICLRNKENGAKGGRPKKNPRKPKKPSGLITNPKNPNEPDNDNDNDIDNVNEEYKKPDKPADFIEELVSLFVSTHGSYEIINPGKERSAASKILQVYKSKYPDADCKQTKEALGKYFEQCVNIPDTWMKQNMSLSLIVSKFNEINNILKNGKHKGSGAGNKELAQLLASKFAKE